jgi:hypothetical protein
MEFACQVYVYLSAPKMTRDWLKHFWCLVLVVQGFLLTSALILFINGQEKRKDN